MQQFKYKGYDAYGKRVDGEMSAATIEEVERRVGAQSVTIIAIVPVGSAPIAWITYQSSVDVHGAWRRSVS